MASRKIKYDSWPELLEAVKKFADQGAKTEINGFDDLSENILTVYGEIEHEYTKRNNACKKALRGQNRAQKQIYHQRTKEAKRE